MSHTFGRAAASATSKAAKTGETWNPKPFTDGSGPVPEGRWRPPTKSPTVSVTTRGAHPVTRKLGNPTTPNSTLTEPTNHA